MILKRKQTASFCSFKLTEEFICKDILLLKENTWPWFRQHNRLTEFIRSTVRVSHSSMKTNGMFSFLFTNYYYKKKKSRHNYFLFFFLSSISSVKVTSTTHMNKHMCLWNNRTFINAGAIYVTLWFHLFNFFFLFRSFVSLPLLLLLLLFFLL